MNKETIATELRRVADAQYTNPYLPRRVFRKYGSMSDATVESTYGSWNEAVEAAGLRSVPPGGIPKGERRGRDSSTGQGTLEFPLRVSDEDLLLELMRLQKELGKRPSIRQISAKSKYDPGRYERRWGSVAEACKVARELFG